MSPFRHRPWKRRIWLRFTGLQAVFQALMAAILVSVGAVPWISASAFVVFALAFLWGWFCTEERPLQVSVWTPPDTPPLPPPPHVEERAEPVRGWRAYAYIRSDQAFATPGQAVANGPILIGARQPWTTSRLEAACVQYSAAVAGFRSECVAHLTAGACSCGIYGRRNIHDIEFATWAMGGPNSWLAPGTVQFHIAAACSAFGVVAADEDGNWRASEVQIDALYIVRLPVYGVDYRALRFALHDRYEVPVMVVDSVDEIPPLPHDETVRRRT